MERKTLIMLALVFLVILSAEASAYYDMTFKFDQKNVEGLAYTCLDSQCAKVSTAPFSYTGSTKSGQLTIVFPSTLQSAYGYAVYFYSPGHVPKAYVTTFHTYGNDGHYYNSYDVSFNKISDCKSMIDSFSITNDLYANEPLVIDVSSSLDAHTYSAFFERDNGVKYVPPAYVDDYYSSDVVVTLAIKDSNGRIVNEQEAKYSADSGNPIYMSSYVDTHFSWTPASDGAYTATVSTEVVDDQCSTISSTAASSAKTFSVLPQRPANECYTIINSLAVDDHELMVGDSITISYTKISNYADASHALYPISTAAEYSIYKGSVASYQSTQKIAANANAIDPATAAIAWNPTESGWYDITVTGKSDSALCGGIGNTADSASLKVYVYPKPTYSVTFSISDAQDGNRVSGAAVSLGGKQVTSNALGVAAVSGLESGDYSYDITHLDYHKISGTVSVVDVDKEVVVTMDHVNRQPVITQLPDITMDEDSKYSFDLDDHVTDSDDPDSDIAWSYAGNSNIGLSVSADHVAKLTPTADWYGAETITFTAADPQNAKASDSIIVTVANVNDAPALGGLPDKTIDEDSGTVDLGIDLYDYASDIDNSDSALSFTIIGQSDASIADCGIVRGSRINCTTKDDKSGFSQITIQVSDGSESATDYFELHVTSVNDGPILGIIPDMSINEDSGLHERLIDLNQYTMGDYEDISYLVYSMSLQDPQVVDCVIADNRYIQCQTLADSFGATTITVIVYDTQSSLSDDASFTLTVVGIDDAPTIAITHPDEEHDEFTEDGLVRVVASATDKDSTDLRYVVDFGDGTDSQGTVNDGAISVQKAYDLAGDYRMTVSVSDGELSASDSIDVKIWPHAYSVTGLKIFNDSAYSKEDYDYFRGERFYASFNVEDFNDGNRLTPDMISSVYMFNRDTPSNIIDLLPFDDGAAIIDGQPVTPDGRYYYYMPSIPLTSDMLGWNIVFTFAHDDTGAGQAEGIILIRNNELVIVPIPDVLIGEPGYNDRLDLDDYVYDLETPDSSILWTFGGNSTVDIDVLSGNRVNFSVESGWEGVEVITATADDRDGSTRSAAFSVISYVNDAPTISGMPDLEILEDSGLNARMYDLYAYASDEDNDILGLDFEILSQTDTSAVMCSLSDKRYIDCATIPGRSGYSDITMQVSDESLSDTDTFRVTVLALNDAPIVRISHPDPEHSDFTEDGLVRVIANATDDDSTGLQYVVYFGDGTDSQGTVKDGTINVQKAYDKAGDYRINVSVSDGSINSSAVIDVRIWPHAYAVTSLKIFNDSAYSHEDYDYFRGESFYAGFNVEDLNDGNRLTPDMINSVYMFNKDTPSQIVNLLPYDNGKTIVGGQPLTPDGRYYYHMPSIPLTSDMLGWNIVFTFTHDGAGSGQAEGIILIRNNELVLVPIPDISIGESGYNDEIGLDDYVYDLETSDANMLWSFAGNSVVDIKVLAGNLVNFSVQAGWEGVEVITATADDRDGSQRSTSFSVSASSNDAPVISYLPDVEILEDSGLNVQLIDLYAYASDEETPDAGLIYSIDGQTGTSAVGCEIAGDRYIQCTTRPEISGTSDISVRVSDGLLYDLDTFRVTVRAADDAPIVDITHPDPAHRDFVEDSLVRVIASVSDIDSQHLNYTVDFGDGTQAHGQVIDRKVNVSHVYEDAGDFSIRVYAYGGESGSQDDASVKIWPHAYNVTMLRTFDTSGYDHESYEFYRGDDLYARFNVIDMNDAGALAPGIISSVYIYNRDKPSQTIDLLPYDNGRDVIRGEPSLPNGTYYYHLPIIPLTSDMLGWNIVMTFVHNGTAAGQAEGIIRILNHELAVLPVPDVFIDERGYYDGLDLDDYVYDLETPKDEISWVLAEDSPYEIRLLPGNRLNITVPAGFEGRASVTATAYDGDGSNSSTQFDIMTGKPRVNLITPNGGEIWHGIERIIWNSTDPKGSQLTAGLHYSSDNGATWRAIASGINDIGIFDWNTSSLTQGKGYMIKVVVSDGFTSAYDISDASFTILESEDRDIAVKIVMDTSSVRAESEVLFKAEIEGGNGPFRYEWDLDGDLRIDSDKDKVAYAFKKEGAYTARLAVYDFDGDKAEGSVLINVGEREKTLTPRRTMHVNNVYFEGKETVAPGDSLDMRIDFENSGNFDMEGVVISATVMDFGEFGLDAARRAGPFDLKSGEVARKRIQISIPEYAHPGEYDVIVAITDRNSGLTRKVVRSFEVAR